MSQRQVILVADLGYGDAGKGSIVDFLTRQWSARTIIRYNGGAQAAHNVIDPNGAHHTFAQFGSGTLVPGVRTHLSRFMLVDPLSLLREERHLQTLGITDALDRLTIDREALLTTPYHQALNRLREIARDCDRHGSCGLGVGETMADALALGERAPRIGNLLDPIGLKQKLQTLREWKLPQLQALRADLPDTEEVRRERAVIEDAHFLDFLVEAYRRLAQQITIVEPSYLSKVLAAGTVIFEGAQGVLLDEWYGFHPYTTWSTTTFHNADALLQEQPYDGQIARLGVLRAYATRHGPGPFVTEDTALTAVLPEAHNVPNAWQLAMRVGHFDAVATRYALAVIGHVDLLAVTHVDRLRALQEWKIATHYTYHGKSTDLSRSNLGPKVDENPPLSPLDFHTALQPRSGCKCPAGAKLDLPDLADFFVMQGEALTDIRMSERPDLEYQEQLTARLQQCHPRYEVQRAGEAAAAVSSFLSQIEREVSVPIGLISAGPTARDKQFTSCWERYAKQHCTPQIV